MAKVVVDDPELSPTPKTIIITEKEVPGGLVPKFLQIEGIAKVSVY